MPQPLPPAFTQALQELGLLAAGEPPHTLCGEPLAGGVSSDIWHVQRQQGALCVKRALPVLRVAAHWQAPVARNGYEAAWMRVAHEAAPGCVPEVLGQHEALGVLVMQWLPPHEHALWKQQLREGAVALATARAVGSTLARIHAHAAARAAQLAPRFASDNIFFDIRLEPYLLATAGRHPDRAAALQALVAQTQGHRMTLVHGDVSPKNILVRRDNPAHVVLLDAECAWWGDPAFDLAFCLNHLLLKCLWVPVAQTALLQAFGTLSEAYLGGVNWEPRLALEQRAAALLPGLLLARVDGKSPVEYLNEERQREAVRRAARALLATPVARLAEVATHWRRELECV